MLPRLKADAVAFSTKYQGLVSESTKLRFPCQGYRCLCQFIAAPSNCAYRKFGRSAQPNCKQEKCHRILPRSATVNLTEDRAAPKPGWALRIGGFEVRESRQRTPTRHNRDTTQNGGLTTSD